jgi:membrane protein implicated in regulation of membrane protease activity
MIVFMTICAIGFVLLVLALVLGEVTDFFGGDADVEADDGIEHAQGGPSVLSFRFIACFITGFGGGGSIGYYYGLGYMFSSLIGLGAAVILASILYAIVSFLFKQQASSNVRVADLAGSNGVVSIAIPANGIGEVSVEFKGRLISQSAQTADGSALSATKLITVKQVIGDKLVVEAAAKGEV